MDYVRVAVFQLQGSKAEVLKLSEGLHPILEAVPGFISHEVGTTVDGKSFITISRWRSKDSAEEGARRAAEFARRQGARLLSHGHSYLAPLDSTRGGAREDARVSAPSHPA